MHAALLELLRCVDCGAEDLSLHPRSRAGDDADDVLAGAVRCESCAAAFAIEDGIPILLPATMRAISAERWRAWLTSREEIEQTVLEADLGTYRSEFRRAAEREGLDEATDAYLWEVRLHEQVAARRGETGEGRTAARSPARERREAGVHERDERALEVVRRREGSLAGRLVLDAGAGDDLHLVRALEAEGARVLCLDLVPAVVQHLGRAHAARRATGGGPPFTGVCADLAHLPFRDGVFDHVLCCEVVHRVQPIDRASREVARVCRDGGTAYLVERNPGHLFTLPGRVLPSRLRRRVRATVRRLLRSDRRDPEGSPHVRAVPIGALAASLDRSGLERVGAAPVVHAPPVIPRPIALVWERLAAFLPFLFDPIALEFVLWAHKPGPSRPD